jgi:hypothetical protein
MNKRVLAGAAATIVGLGTVMAGSVAPAHASLTGATLVSTPSDPDSNDKEARAECPAGTVVYGGGGRIHGGEGEVLISAIIPDPGLGFVTVRGEEDGDFLGDWRVMAMAVCGPPGNHNLRVETAPSAANGSSVSPRSAYAFCDPGEVVFSAGFELSFEDGNVFIAEMEPVPALDRVEIQAVEDFFTYTDNWDVTAYAICGVPDTSTVELTTAVSSGQNSNEVNIVEAACDAGATTIGIGGATHDTAGNGYTNTVQDRFSYTFGLTEIETAARENGGGPDLWEQLSYAICLT